MESSVSHHLAGHISKGLDSALYRLGDAELECWNDAVAASRFKESIQVAREQQHQYEIAQGYAGLGIVAVLHGDLDSAESYYASSLASLRREFPNASLHHEEPESLGVLALMLERYTHALAHYEAELSSQGNTGYRVPLMRAHCRLGLTLIAVGDQTGAVPHLFEALREAAAVGTSQVLLESLVGVAQLTGVMPALAAELLALVREHPASNRFTRMQAECFLTNLESAMAPDDLREAADRGKALTLQAAVALVGPLYQAAETTQMRANQQLIDPLTPRELELLALMAQGYTNQEIADQLVIGISTVKKHINRIFSKLDVNHRAQAVAYARTLNILA